MDKTRRLRRYDRKDYTLVVDFPVEIVGRDGVVRRYSFEDSIRLYQRRIASAGLRYHDGDVADAEVAHCQRRIDQLRRSYFARYGWSSLQRVSGSAVIDEGLAGEVAAFLRRVVDGSDNNPELFSLTALDSPDGPRIFYVQLTDPTAEHARERFLLYLYRFEAPGDCESRTEFFGQLKMLQAVRGAGEGVESLLSFHHTADCGLVLTGRPGAIAPRHEGEAESPGLNLGWLEARRDEEGPQAGLALLRQGRPADALAAFLRAQEENPWRRSAAVGAIVVADALGDAGNMETAALLGVRHFPTDPVLWHGLAVARLRLGDLGGAEEALATAERHDGVNIASCVVGAILALRQMKAHRARQRLRQLRRLDRGQAPELDPARRWVFAAQGAVLGADLGVVALAVFGAYLRGPAGVVVSVVVGVLLAMLVRVGLSRYMAARLSRHLPMRLARTSATEGEP